MVGQMRPRGKKKTKLFSWVAKKALKEHEKGSPGIKMAATSRRGGRRTNYWEQKKRKKRLKEKNQANQTRPDCCLGDVAVGALRKNHQLYEDTRGKVSRKKGLREKGERGPPGEKSHATAGGSKPMLTREGAEKGLKGLSSQSLHCPKKKKRGI